MDPDAPALVVAGTELTAAQVVERARADAKALGLTAPGARLLSDRPYDSWEGLSAGLYAPLAAGSSVVLCRNMDRLPHGGAGQADRERARHRHGGRRHGELMARPVPARNAASGR